VAVIDTLETAAAKAREAQRLGGRSVEIVCATDRPMFGANAEVFAGCWARVVHRTETHLICSTTVTGVLLAYGRVIQRSLLGSDVIQRPQSQTSRQTRPRMQR